MTTRIIVADDHQVVRKGIIKLLELEADDIVVVGEAENGATLLDAIQSLAPDVVLLDLMMPLFDVFDQVKQITSIVDGPRILIFTGLDGDEYVADLISAGVSGYMLKEEMSATIVQAIRAVAQGQTWFSQQIAGRLLRSTYAPPADAEDETSASPLTPREWGILQMIGQGKANSEIADQLALSKATVQNYVSNIYTKLGIETRAQAMLYAMRNNMVDVKEVIAPIYE